MCVRFVRPCVRVFVHACESTNAKKGQSVMRKLAYIVVYVYMNTVPEFNILALSNHCQYILSSPMNLLDLHRIQLPSIL